MRHQPGGHAGVRSFWQNGWLEIPQPAEEYVLFGDFRADPEQHKLATPSGRIELYSERIAGFGYDDCPPHPTWIEPREWLGATSAATYPLHLVSSQPRDRLHSQMDSGPGQRAAARSRAARRSRSTRPTPSARGIGDGDVVRVYNARGACLAGAVVTDTVSPGRGAALVRRLVRPADRTTSRALRARQRRTCSPATMAPRSSSQGPSSATTLVEIERFNGIAPPVRAFVPPPIVDSAATA